ncbi:hypothetical protein [Alkaliphilus oremlandii]|nr:hypothetical protein [Alkaliphilus oremlandii]
MSGSTRNSKEDQKQFILSNNMWKVMFELSWPAVIAILELQF